MFAAEKAGLLNGRVFGKEQYCDVNKWYVADHASGDYGCDPLARDESGPMAICLAILKLKENQ
jgi:hypothetical protein